MDVKLPVEIEVVSGSPAMELPGDTVDLGPECTITYQFTCTGDAWKFVECTALSDPKAQQVAESEC